MHFQHSHIYRNRIYFVDYNYFLCLFICYLQKSLKPPLPNDTLISFYIQAQKLVLAVYSLYVNPSQKIDIHTRHQVKGLGRGYMGSTVGRIVIRNAVRFLSV